jgi:hypothetical protein
MLTGPRNVLDDCVDPALSEAEAAHVALSGFMERLAVKLADLKASRTQQQIVSLALAVDDVSKTAHQIQQLAESMHRGLAKKLNLEARTP